MDRSLQPLLKKTIAPPAFSGEGYQKVQVEPNGEGFIFADTDNSITNSQTFDLFDFSKTLLAPDGNRAFVNRQSEYIAVRSIDFCLNIYNVNDNNNLVQFISSNTGATIHGATILTGIYQTQVSLMNALTTALNALTGTTGLTFSYIVNPVNPLVYSLNTAGGDYYFIDIVSNATLQKGKFLYNLSRNQTLNSSQIVGPVWGLASRYYDITSTNLTESTRVPSEDGGVRGANALLYRFFMREEDRFATGSIGKEYADQLRWVRIGRDKIVQQVDMFIYDEWGDLAPIFRFDFETPSSNWISVSMLAQ